ncbi:MAG: hypothetical protein HY318_04480 [Armatimonadetes bacterium]|nr:hypothetical protein [Armatimonadota bacterium]
MMRSVPRSVRMWGHCAIGLALVSVVVSPQWLHTLGYEYLVPGYDVPALLWFGGFAAIGVVVLTSIVATIKGIKHKSPWSVVEGTSALLLEGALLWSGLQSILIFRESGLF